MMNTSPINKQESISLASLPAENHTSSSKARKCFNRALVIIKDASSKTKNKLINAFSYGKNTKKSLHESAQKKWAIIKNTALSSIKTMKKLFETTANLIRNKQVTIFKNIRKLIPTYKLSTQSFSKHLPFRKLKNMGHKGIKLLVDIRNKCRKQPATKQEKPSESTIPIIDKKDKSNTSEYVQQELTATNNNSYKY